MKTSLIPLISTLLLAQAAVAGSSLKTAQAEYREIAVEHRLDGVVEAANQGTLSAQTSGQVLQILVDVDQYVEKDELVIRLKSTQQKASLTQAKSELNTATARLDEVKNQNKRILAMHAKGLVSNSAMDQANANLRAAEARLNAAEAGLEQAQEQVRYTEVRAPFSGIVTQRHIEEGETANPGQKLISGLSLEKLRVNVNVPQSLIQQIKQSGKAKIELPNGKIIETTKLTVFPYAQAGSNSFKVRLELSTKTPGLFPGMYVKTDFVVGSKQQLSIPQQSVVFRSEVTGVYVLNKDGRVSFRHVRLGGKIDNNNIAILAGLEPKEQVALDPISAGELLKQQAQANKESNGE